MFKTFQGVTEDAKNTVYLRPETAQGIFVNFKNVQRTSRKKIPFGIGQIGKSFRNEITPGNFTFRTREFEQMELEFFLSLIHISCTCLWRRDRRDGRASAEAGRQSGPESRTRSAAVGF